MTTPVATRFTDEELATIDDPVAAGIGQSRSAVVRQAVHHLADAVHRARIGATISDSYRECPQSPSEDELAMASAVALTEAEPW